MEDEVIAEFIGSTKSELSSLGRSIDYLRTVTVDRFAENSREQERRFKEQGERIGKLEDDFNEHKQVNGGWVDKKVAAGAGSGVGLVGLIELVKWISS